jgi:phage tail-like protein
MNSLLEEQLASILSGSKAEPGRQSWLLNYLPGIYAGDDFLNRFLLIFEDTLRPLQLMTDNLHYYFHPLTAPSDLIPWLATWVNLVLDDNWTMEQRRHLIYTAPELYSRRGTRRGLIEYLTLYTGVVPDISEYVDGMVLGPETRLGINTRIAGAERHRFTVTMYLPEMTEEELTYKEQNIRRVIDTEKPAHTTYRLVLKTRKGGDGPAETETTSPDDGIAKAPDSQNGKHTNGVAKNGKTEVVAKDKKADGKDQPAPKSQTESNGDEQPVPTGKIETNGDSQSAPTGQIETNGESHPAPSGQIETNGESHPAPTGQIEKDGDSNPAQNKGLETDGDNKPGE